MKVSNREFSFIMLAAVLFALSFILFGTIIGQVSFEEANGQIVMEWVSALSSFVAGISTLGLLLVAPKVVKDWLARQEIELLIRCKKDVILTQEFMYNWLNEAKLCCKAPREDSIAIQAKLKVDNQVQSALSNAAHWDALQVDRDAWLMDEILRTEQIFRDAYREANYPFHYKPSCKDAEGNLMPFNLDEALEKRNVELSERKKEISNITNALISKLDGL
ncbi:hypothetical protein HJA62_004380 [Vibrio vulnificus]|nr:hypothetical protein [Vibrio vulnificus]